LGVEFAEDISYKIWKKEQSKIDEIEKQTNQLTKISKSLNERERKVVDMLLENNTYGQIAHYLEIDQGEIRKIVYFASEKLKARHSLK